MLGENDPNVRTRHGGGQRFRHHRHRYRPARGAGPRRQRMRKSSDEELRAPAAAGAAQPDRRNAADPGSQGAGDRGDHATKSTRPICASPRRISAERRRRWTPISPRSAPPPASLKRQIEGELAWQRLLRRNVQPFVNVSEEEVNELLERLKAAKGTEEYRLGEIYLAATPETEAAVFAERPADRGAAPAGRQFRRLCAPIFAGFDRSGRRRSRLGPPGAASQRAGHRRARPAARPVGRADRRSRAAFRSCYLIDKRQVLTADPRDAVLSLKQISIDFARR